MPTDSAVMILAAIAPAREQQQQQRADKAGDDPACRHRVEPAQTPSSDRHTDEGARHHHSGSLAVGLPPRIRKQWSRGDEIDHEQQCCDQARRGDAARQRHENQRRTEAGKSAGGSRDKGCDANRDRGREADVGRDELRGAHPRSIGARASDENGEPFEFMPASCRRSSWSLPRRSWRRRHRFPDRSGSSRAAGSSPRSRSTSCRRRYPCLHRRRTP